jgi:DnaK suppressor protein
LWAAGRYGIRVVARKPKKKTSSKKKVASRKATARKKAASKRASKKKTGSKKSAAKRAKKSPKKKKKPAARKSVKRSSRKPAKAPSAPRKQAASKRSDRRSRPAAAPASPPTGPKGAPDAIAAPPVRVRRLSQKDLAQFRELLLAKRSELIGDVSTLQNEALSKNRQDAAGDLSSMPIHMADLGTDNYEKEFTLGLIEGERALLRDIDDALKRIQDGTYGICQATGKPIGRARLRARPWAKYCYEYVLAQEQGQRSEGY